MTSLNDSSLLFLLAEFLSIPISSQGILSQVIFLSGGIQMQGISEQVSVGLRGILEMCYEDCLESLSRVPPETHRIAHCSRLRRGNCWVRRFV